MPYVLIPLFLSSLATAFSAHATLPLKNHKISFIFFSNWLTKSLLKFLKYVVQNYFKILMERGESFVKVTKNLGKNKLWGKMLLMLRHTLWVMKSMKYVARWEYKHKSLQRKHTNRQTLACLNDYKCAPINSMKSTFKRCWEDCIFIIKQIKGWVKKKNTKKNSISKT